MPAAFAEFLSHAALLAKRGGDRFDPLYEEKYHEH
jgi:hypothetical protein